jgi:hypothetical protein
MNRQAIETVRAALPTMTGNSQAFAASVVQQFDRRGDLSPRQWECIARMAQQLSTAGSTAPVVAAEGVQTLYRWLKGARERGLKRPSVRYPFGGSAIKFSLPSANSRYVGEQVVFVKCDADYAGRLQDAALHLSGRFTAPRGFAARVAEIAAEPFQQAVAAGHASGSCCFCGRELTDPRSVQHGYGPVCAGHYGLPWNADRDAARVDATAVFAEASEDALLGAVDPAEAEEAAAIEREEREALSRLPVTFRVAA